jgi:glycosyltransferase involved in cell wall biosynthesis
MQSCDVFLAMNVGKDPLWGEGCPRTTIEALSTGCVVLAFDIIGNREIIQNNFNGILIPRYRPDLMADSLIDLYKATGEINRLRRNAQSIINHCHTLESRWPAVRDFLDLPNN